jgi:hypothetical protein
MSVAPTREAARERVFRRQVFVAAITALAVISPTILVVYWLTGPYPSFWPAYPIVGLLIASGYTAARAFAGLPGDISDYDIEREIRRTMR